MWGVPVRRMSKVITFTIVPLCCGLPREAAKQRNPSHPLPISMTASVSPLVRLLGYPFGASPFLQGIIHPITTAPLTLVIAQ